MHHFYSDFFYTSISSLFLRRPTLSATQLLTWLGEEGCPHVLVSQVILSDHADWLMPGSKFPGQGFWVVQLRSGVCCWSNLLFSSRCWVTLYKHDSHGPIPEDGELGPVVKRVILSWENTLIRELLNNYYDIWDSTTSDIGCSVIMLQFGV